MIAKHIFVVGTGRCGTKWIDAWLREHPRVFGGPESHLFDRIHELLQFWPETGPIPWLDDNEKRMISLIRNFAKEFYSYRMSGYRDCLVDSTPLHIEHRDLIKKVFPNSKFIHVYRDGKYYVWSVTRSPWGRKRSARYWSEHWKTTMEKMHTDPHEDQMNVKYEDLIAKPKLSRLITSFLGLKHHGDIEPWSKPVNTRNTGYDPNKWMSLPEEDRRDMTIMNDQLRLNGYETV